MRRSIVVRDEEVVPEQSGAAFLALLRQDFILPEGVEDYDETRLLQWLADAVDHLMQYRMEFLMSLCYTLDIDEAALAAAVHPAAEEPANVGLARLLYRRQWQRAVTKATFKPPVLDDDENAW